MIASTKQTSGVGTKIQSSYNATNSVITLICIHHLIYLPMSILHLNLILILFNQICQTVQVQAEIIMKTRHQLGKNRPN